MIAESVLAMKNTTGLINDRLPMAAYQRPTTSKMKLRELNPELMSSYEESLDMQDALEKSIQSCKRTSTSNATRSTLTAPAAYVNPSHKHPSLCRVDTMSTVRRDEGRLADTCTNHAVTSILRTSRVLPVNSTPRVISCNSKHSCNYSCRCSCNPRSLELLMPGQERKVQFHAHVFVHYVHPYSGDHVRTECVRLKGGPERNEAKRRWQRLNVSIRKIKVDSPEAFERLGLNQTWPQSQFRQQLSVVSDNPLSVSWTEGHYRGMTRQDSEVDTDSVPNDSCSDSSSERCSIVGRVSASVLSSDNEALDDSCNYERLDINFVQDSRNINRTLLKFTIKIGLGFNPDDVIVKVNKAGLKLKIQATRVDSEGRTIEMIRRYLLPKNIQSSCLEADLDKKGMLRVEAPLV